MKVETILTMKIFYFIFYIEENDVYKRQEQKKLQVSDIRLIFGGVVKIMEEMMEFLLNPDQLLLSPEYMYPVSYTHLCISA